jgi:hypothetical protein
MSGHEGHLGFPIFYIWVCKIITPLANILAYTITIEELGGLGDNGMISLPLAVAVLFAARSATPGIARLHWRRLQHR